MEHLTLPRIKTAIPRFCEDIEAQRIGELFGVTDGKAIGTYLEQALKRFLGARYIFSHGNAAAGIDFPDLNLDLKVTSARQPQSSCPYQNAAQKVYGLGYNLLILVYTKHDDPIARVGRLTIDHAILVSAPQTADFQTTYGLLEILRRQGNLEDVIAFLEERNLPLDETGRMILAERIMREPPEQGYLTISNALQWRLQYGRAIQVAVMGITDGIENLRA